MVPRGARVGKDRKLLGSVWIWIKWQRIKWLSNSTWITVQEENCLPCRCLIELNKVFKISIDHKVQGFCNKILDSEYYEPLSHIRYFFARYIVPRTETAVQSNSNFRDPVHVLKSCYFMSYFLQLVIDFAVDGIIVVIVLEKDIRVSLWAGLKVLVWPIQTLLLEETHWTSVSLKSPEALNYNFLSQSPTHPEQLYI